MLGTIRNEGANTLMVASMSWLEDSGKVCLLTSL